MQIHRTVFHVLNALPDFFLLMTATNIEIRKRVFCCCRVIHELQVVLVSLFLSRTAVTTNVRTFSVFWKTISSCLLWKTEQVLTLVVTAVRERNKLTSTTCNSWMTRQQQKTLFLISILVAVINKKKSGSALRTWKTVLCICMRVWQYIKLIKDWCF
jgi:hypothetical protein